MVYKKFARSFSLIAIVFGIIMIMFKPDDMIVPFIYQMGFVGLAILASLFIAARKEGKKE